MPDRRRPSARPHLLQSARLAGRCRATPTTARERPRALLQYIDSMRATRELPARLVLPGHGDPITDHVALIDERLRMHRRRATRILADPRRRAAHRLRDRAPDVGQRRGHAGLPDALGGPRTHGPARPKRRRSPIERDGTGRRGPLRGRPGYRNVVTRADHRCPDAAIRYREDCRLAGDMVGDSDTGCMPGGAQS